MNRKEAHFPWKIQNISHNTHIKSIKTWYYSAAKKNEVMSFATTWMDLEIVILSEVRHREISHDIIYMQNFLKKKDVINTMFKMDIGWRPTYCTGSAAQNYVTVQKGKEFETEKVPVYA